MRAFKTLSASSHASDHPELGDFNKRRVFIALYEREELSVGLSRRRLEHAAYHWEIIITPKDHSGSDCYAYSVTNGPIQKGKGHIIDGNRERIWQFREEQINPDISSLLVGMIMIGKVPSQVTRDDIKKNISPPTIQVSDKLWENGTTWIKEAIAKLQESGLAEEFYIQQFMDDALAFADHYTKHGLGRKCHFSISYHCFVHPRMKCPMLNYTKRPMW